MNISIVNKNPTIINIDGVDKSPIELSEEDLMSIAAEFGIQISEDLRFLKLCGESLKRADPAIKKCVKRMEEMEDRYFLDHLDEFIK
jgi:hypothetical protein